MMSVNNAVKALQSIFILILLSHINGAHCTFPFIIPSAPLFNENIAPLKEGLSYKTLYYEQKVDHLGFANRDTYKQRFLLADQFWKKNGPIFFFTGGESNIEWYCHNMGFLWDIAPQFNAMLVFAEHRYYGKSVPYGPDPFQNYKELNYLTTEQALVDYAELIQHLKGTISGAENSSVVAFGSAYSGMLAAWFRIKYPNVVVGSLASSAPVWQFTGITDCEVFYEKIAKVWREVSQECVMNIDGVWYMLGEIASRAFGFRYISRAFDLCEPVRTADDLWKLTDFIRTSLIVLTQANFPYPANYMAELPAWPVEKACRFLKSPLKDYNLIRGVGKLVKFLYTHHGKQKCVDWTRPIHKDIGYTRWNYQFCTEMFMPTCNGHLMFDVLPFNVRRIREACVQHFNVTPRENWVTTEYWGTTLGSASNIIFSNGLLDPYSGGSVLQDISDTVVAIQMPQGAQSLDLRFKNDKDTPDVIKAREQEVSIIREWLKKP